MKRTKIKELWTNAAAFDGAHITVCGWARTIRDMKNFGFLELNDGSSFKGVQVVLEREKVANYDEIVRQNVGAAFIAEGHARPHAGRSPAVRAQGGDRHGRGRFLAGLPAAEKAPQRQYLRTIQHLRPRTNLFSAAFRVRSVAAAAVHEFFQSRGFVYVNTPIITGSDCGGAGEMFQVTTLDIDNPPRTPDGKVDYSRTSSASARASQSPASSTPKTSPWRSATCTPLGRRSAPRTPTPSATPPSSG